MKSILMLSRNTGLNLLETLMWGDGNEDFI